MLWSVLGWMLVAGVIVGSLIPGQALEVVDVSDKVMHAGAYLLLMIWFAGFYRRSLYPLIAAVLLALGVGPRSPARAHGDTLVRLVRRRDERCRDRRRSSVIVAAARRLVPVGRATFAKLARCWTPRSSARISMA